MSAFASDKASLGVGIVPDWLFWLILWWAAWFAAFLSWYGVNNHKPRDNIGLVIFFVAMFAGLMPLIIVFAIIRKLMGKDK